MEIHQDSGILLDDVVESIEVLNVDGACRCVGRFDAALAFVVARPFHALDQSLPFSLLDRLAFVFGFMDGR